MAEDSKIAWTRSTFNPWIGCTKVSPGCDHCYAEAQDARLRWGPVAHWGPGVARHRTSTSTWRQPLAWNRKAAETGERWLVFCGSLCDVFDNEVPASWVFDLWQLVDSTPHLTWLLLTKRIGNAAKRWATGFQENVWLGASVVNQEEADRDIPKLLATPAEKRFVSYEPALGPISFRWLRAWNGSALRPRLPNAETVTDHLDGLRRLDWIIVGGESGPKARPFVHRWAKDVVAQCRAAGVACFVKQMGSNAVNREGERHVYRDRAGADPSEWPEDLRVQEFPA